MSHQPHIRTIFTLISVLVLGVVALLVGVEAARRGSGSAKSPPLVLHTTHAVPHVRHSFTILTNERIAHWALVLRRVKAFSEPSSGTPVVTTLPTLTGDGTQNIVLVLGEVTFGSKESWYHVRLAILPNGSTGWVPRAALGRLYSVTTHLYVDLETTTATLERNGVAVFRTVIGVGRSYWPTPRGQFYVRDKLIRFHDPSYGPVAFGTSARSAVLTGWPGGGYIGIHGTDAPQILPGHVSHGCVRMRNQSILTLARLMPVGTPVTIS